MQKCSYTFALCANGFVSFTATYEHLYTHYFFITSLLPLLYSRAARASGRQVLGTITNIDPEDKQRLAFTLTLAKLCAVSMGTTSHLLPMNKPVGCP